MHFVNKAFSTRTKVLGAKTRLVIDPEGARARGKKNRVFLNHCAAT